MTFRPLVIARLSLRTAIRSKVVLSLLVLLGTAVVALPQTLHGDGTPAGDIRMLLTWTLGSTLAIMAFATLWAGCNAISSEIRDGAFSSVAVTPVRPWELWLGKWLGLVALDAGLLVLVLATLAAQLPARGLSFAELRPYEQILPNDFALRQHAQRIYDLSRAANQLPPDLAALPAETAVARLASELRDQPLPVNPGNSQRWRFDWVAAPGDPDTELRVRVDMVSSFGRVEGTLGRVTVRDTATERLIASADIDEASGRYPEVVFRSSACSNAAFTVALDNLGDEKDSAVLVNAADGAMLYVRRSSFGANLACAGLALLSVLAVVAALGVSAGAMFSLPVAVFVASAFAVVGIIGQPGFERPVDEEDAHDHHVHASAVKEEGEATISAAHSMRLLNHFSTTVLTGISHVTAPFAETAPLDRLGDRILVPPAAALRCAASFGLLLPFLLSLPGIQTLRRREYP